MPAGRQAEITGIVKPSVDEQRLDRETGKIQRSMDRAADLKPDIDVRGIRRKLERAIPGGGLLGSAVDGLTGQRGPAGGGSGGGVVDGGIQASQLEKLDDIHEELEKIGASGGFGGGGGGGGLGSTGLGFGLGSLLGGGGSTGGSILAALSGSTTAGVAGGLGLGAVGTQILSNLGVHDAAEDAGQTTRETIPFGEEIGDAAQFLPGLPTMSAIEPLAFGDVGGAVDRFTGVWEDRADILENVFGGGSSTPPEELDLFGGNYGDGGGSDTGTEELDLFGGNYGDTGGESFQPASMTEGYNDRGLASDINDEPDGGLAAMAYEEDDPHLDSRTTDRSALQGMAYEESEANRYASDTDVTTAMGYPDYEADETGRGIRKANRRLSDRGLSVERGPRGGIAPSSGGDYPDWALELFNNNGQQLNQEENRAREGRQPNANFDIGPFELSLSDQQIERAVDQAIKNEMPTIISQLQQAITRGVDQ